MSETSDPSDGSHLAYEAATAQLFKRIERSCRRADEWPYRVRAALEAVLALFAADPALAGRLIFEPYAGSSYAQLRHEETLARLAELLRDGRDSSTALLPDLLEEGLVGSIVFIVGRLLRAGEPQSLPDLAAELTALVLTPYLGHEEAERIATGE